MMSDCWPDTWYSVSFSHGINSNRMAASNSNHSWLYCMLFSCLTSSRTVVVVPWYDWWRCILVHGELGDEEAATVLFNSSTVLLSTSDCAMKFLHTLLTTDKDAALTCLYSPSPLPVPYNFCLVSSHETYPAYHLFVCIVRGQPRK